MNAKIVSVAEATANITSIVRLLVNGGLVAVPTDTIYGIACSVHCTKALQRIYQLKGRSSSKPMAICVEKVSSISHWCDTTKLPHGILHDLLPGPVTVLLPRFPSDHLNPQLNPGVHFVGVRVPDSGFVCDLVAALSRESGTKQNGFTDCLSHPLVLTSANLSGDKSALSIEEFSSLWPSLDLVVDGGPILVPNDLDPIASRAGSTIVDLSESSKNVYRLVRDGSALESTTQILEQQYGLRRLE